MARGISGEYHSANVILKMSLTREDRQERVGYTYSCSSNCIGNQASTSTSPSTSLVRAGSKIGTMSYVYSSHYLRFKLTHGLKVCSSGFCSHTSSPRW